MDVTGRFGFQPHLHKATSGRQRWCAHLQEILNLYQDVELSGLRSCPWGWWIIQPLIDREQQEEQEGKVQSPKVRRKAPLSRSVAAEGSLLTLHCEESEL